MTKLYKFQQILYNHREPYFEMIGTIDDIIHRWHCGPWLQILGQYVPPFEDEHNKLLDKVIMSLDKQGFYIKFVDEDCYGVGWMTKIEKIEE